jgi:hypothetical protein
MQEKIGFHEGSTVPNQYRGVEIPHQRPGQQGGTANAKMREQAGFVRAPEVVAEVQGQPE